MKEWEETYSFFVGFEKGRHFMSTKLKKQTSDAEKQSGKIDILLLEEIKRVMDSRIGKGDWNRYEGFVLYGRAAIR